MKIINYFVTFVCISFGIAIGFYLLNSYEDKENIKLANLSSEELIFFKYKEYNNEDEMKKDVMNLNSYIYTKENNKYHVYLAITKNEKNISKIKGFFEKKGYVISEEKIMVSNEHFLKQIENYDLLLQNTDKEEVIEAIISGVLEKYEEAVREN